MYAAEFDYHRPKTLGEATRLLQSNKDARLLAGGHSLIPAMKLRLAAPSALVDLSGLKELGGIKVDGNTLRIGALTTHAAIVSSPEVAAGCPVLAEAAAQIGDLQVRNHFPTVMVALGATLLAAGPSGSRDIPAEGFFKDLFTTDLQPAEILTAVRVPTYGKGKGGAYLKHRHPASSYAVVGVAAVVEAKDGKCVRASVVVGGATVNPVRAKAAEAALAGQPLDDARIAAAAAKVAEAIQDPLGDHYASGEYRTHLATVLARRALVQAASRARS
jgi:carbon-monoxide dehydrogenase medium subunit